jgi:4-amino-4-deoxy-L-arabinose transferase-like glycosyltransferase
MVISDNSEVIQFRAIHINKRILILFLWLVLTGININKAFHIDDTFHLEASEWIKDNPTHPMSGFINWKDVPTPIYSHNQPPLFFFLIALFSLVFGESEIALHLLLSVFTFLGLFYFYKIAVSIKAENTNALLVLFALCPAFVVNQNLMTDIPILALILGAAYYLIKAGHSGKLLNYFLAAFLLGTGLMIKYSVLPLLVALFIIIVARRDYKYLSILFVPVIILIIWSSWNYIEYGSIHFFDRPKGEIHINRLWSFLACLGSMSVFSMAIISGIWPYRITNRIIFSLLLLLFVSIFLFLFNVLNETLYSNMLNLAFVINGFLVIIPLFIILSNKINSKGWHAFLSSDYFIFILFTGAISAFLVLFAPFIATRHILLAIPFILLSGHDYIAQATKSIFRISVVLTVYLGLQLGYSDWKYADFYRKMASGIHLTGDSKIWTAGHWGWQWYAARNGMEQYAYNQSDVKDGDYFIYPADIPRQKIGENIKLNIIDKKWDETGIMSFISGNNFGSLYSSSLRNATWRLSKLPIDTIYICKVEIIKSDSVRLMKTTR